MFGIRRKLDLSHFVPFEIIWSVLIMDSLGFCMFSSALVHFSSAAMIVSEFP